MNTYLYDGLIIARKVNDFMTTHQLKLATEPFNAIISGDKTIESRLYDAKRQKIQIGDRIIFTNRDNSEQTVTAEVVGLLRYATFRDLFSHNNPRKFGGDNVEWLENQISEFYSIEDQKIYGVIGIEFKVCQ
ncbi:ASCH domain-containing protein [Candidatus Nanosynbacter sp. TM7-008]|uniref:ASCH domain-containing protein n=1 Tax=Candidatus Nanosynbacter sp. TM7-008 TaxID=2902632 RepID=UPI003CEAE227